MVRNTQNAYGWLAILFHWSMAAMIIGMLGLGLYMHGLPLTDADKFPLYQLHKSIGFLVLLMAALRLLWRLVNPAPTLPAAMPVWEKVLAHLGHLGLYGLMFALPVSGWLMVSASPLGLPTVIFDSFVMPHLPVPAVMGDKASVEGVFREIHEIMAWALILLLIGHVAAAMKHHFISKDTTLVRMLKPKRL